MLAIFSSFDLNLEKFGVNVDELKQLATHRVFHAWVEDWEEKLMLKDDIVLETRILEKCKNLVCYNPDQDINFTVCNKNLEFVKKQGDRGWHVIGIPHNATFDDELFDLQLACQVISDTRQADGVMIVRQKQAEEGKEEWEEEWVWLFFNFCNKTQNL